MKAVECKPDSREAACNVAVCLFRLGRYKESAETAKGVIDKHPDYPTALAVYAAANTKLSEEVKKDG